LSKLRTAIPPPVLAHEAHRASMKQFGLCRPNGEPRGNRIALLLQSIAVAPSAAHREQPVSTAAEENGAIGQILLGPLFEEPYFRMEHPAGQLKHPGDALGTD